MKNREKYAKEILNIALEHDAVAVTRKDGIVMGCSQIEYCEDCLFYTYPGSSCKREFKEWANSEYREGKHFTDREKQFIKLFPEIKYVARDAYGDLFAYTDKPQKDEGMWDYFGCNNPAATLKRITLWGLDFNSIQWEDEEPTSREEILGDGLEE